MSSDKVEILVINNTNRKIKFCYNWWTVSFDKMGILQN